MQESGVENVYFAPLKLDFPDTPRAITTGTQVLNGVSYSHKGFAGAVRSNIQEPGSQCFSTRASPRARGRSSSTASRIRIRARTVTT